MSKAITEKKYYRVGETFSYTDKDYNGLLDVPFGIWITTHSFEVISSMKWEKALDILLCGLDRNIKYKFMSKWNSYIGLAATGLGV